MNHHPKMKRLLITMLKTKNAKLDDDISKKILFIKFIFFLFLSILPIRFLKFNYYLKSQVLIFNVIALYLI